jgi:hypothetical protein
MPMSLRGVVTTQIVRVSRFLVFPLRLLQSNDHFQACRSGTEDLVAL